MTNKVRERPKLNLDTDDDLDLSDFGVSDVSEEPQVEKVTEPTAAAVEAVSKEAGFPSRSATKTTPRRRRKKTSPFQDQVGIKCRTAMKDLFQDLGDELNTHDHTTFERAIYALLKEVGDPRLIARYEQIVRG